MKPHILKYIILGQVVVLSAWTVLEKAFTKATIGSLIVILVILAAQYFYPIRTKTGNRRFQTITILTSLLFLSIYILQLSSFIIDTDYAPTLNLPYRKLMYVSYAIMYLLVVCLILLAPVSIIRHFSKRKGKQPIAGNQ